MRKPVILAILDRHGKGSGVSSVGCVKRTTTDRL